MIAFANRFHSAVTKRHSSLKARTVTITTPHGIIHTPAFMAVGTRAAVNNMSPQDLITANCQIILGGNTYHMLCAPGLEVIEQNGGMHKFMAWSHPMLTDSGGFQVFSLSKNGKLCVIGEEGARFKHPTSGKLIHLTPKTSIEAQKVIGADIIMAFDECTPEKGGREKALMAMQRTHRWLRESKDLHDSNQHSAYGLQQALFGIIQGGSFRDLREESAEFITQLQLDGIAIGGEMIGFDMEKTKQTLDWIIPMLPEQKVRYTMGVGLYPQDLIDVVARGVDIFDCVAPTRNARHGALYYGTIVKVDGWVKFEELGPNGRLLIKKSLYAHDENPIMAECPCFTCKHYSRAYLHYLFKTNASSYSNLACIHNVSMMNAVCDAMRECILAT